MTNTEPSEHDHKIAIANGVAEALRSRLQGRRVTVRSAEGIVSIHRVGTYRELKIICLGENAFQLLDNRHAPVTAISPPPALPKHTIDQQEMTKHVMTWLEDQAAQ